MSFCESFQNAKPFCLDAAKRSQRVAEVGFCFLLVGLCFVEEMLAGLVDGLDGVLVLGVKEVEQVGEQIDGAGDGVGVEVALGLVPAHGVAGGAGAEAVGGVGIEEAVGGDDEVGVVWWEGHGG